MNSNTDQKATPVAPAAPAAPATPNTPVLPDSIDPDAQYVVHLASPVDVLGQRLYPGRRYRLRGDVLIPVKASVKDATELR
ncbi:MAG: hypothetical protein P4L40_17245 [Terracidiphilus sp.]|nr:hypothetical protein [Terracidiphilus sp.]